MMRRLLLTALLTLVGSTTTVLAQNQNANSGENPFKLNVGPQDGGGFGVTVKGQAVRLLFGGPDHAGFAIYGVDGALNSETTKTNNIEAFVKPGIVLFGRKGLDYDLAATADLMQRYGELKTTTGNVAKVSQSILGATVIWIPRPFQRWVEPPTGTSDPADCWYLGTCKDKAIVTDAPPTVTISYYHPFDESSQAAAVPDTIVANKIEAHLKGDLGIVNRAASAKYPLRFVFDFSATKPTTGADRAVQKKIDVGIGVRMNNKVTPMLQYVSGKQGGFKYDRQVILGLLWRAVN